MAITTTERIIHVVETIIQHIVVLFFLLIVWELFKYYSFTDVGTWHIVLCTLGIALCMAEALLLFSPESTLLREVDRTTRGTYHGVVMFLSCCCLTIGIALKIYQKNDRGSDHFTSTHGILGLVTWILVFLAVFGGVATAYSKNLSSLARPRWLKLCHLLIGVSAYIIGVVTVGFGLHYLEVYTSERGRIALIVFLCIYVIYSLKGSAISCYNLILNK